MRQKSYAKEFHTENLVLLLKAHLAAKSVIGLVVKKFVIQPF